MLVKTYIIPKMSEMFHPNIEYRAGMQDIQDHLAEEVAVQLQVYGRSVDSSLPSLTRLQTPDVFVGLSDGKKVLFRIKEIKDIRYIPQAIDAVVYTQYSDYFYSLVQYSIGENDNEWHDYILTAICSDKPDGNFVINAQNKGKELTPEELQTAANVLLIIGETLEKDYLDTSLDPYQSDLL